MTKSEIRYNNMIWSGGSLRDGNDERNEMVKCSGRKRTSEMVARKHSCEKVIKKVSLCTSIKVQITIYVNNFV